MLYDSDGTELQKVTEIYLRLCMQNFDTKKVKNLLLDKNFNFKFVTT